MIHRNAKINCHPSAIVSAGSPSAVQNDCFAAEYHLALENEDSRALDLLTLYDMVGFGLSVATQVDDLE